MPEPVLHSETFPEGYRLTTTGTELRIDPTEANPRSLHLDRDALARFHLCFQDDHYIDVTTGKEAEGVVDKMLASLDRAIDLMKMQEHKGSWKWDIDNLKRIWTILGGLDEKVVQQIPDEEGK